MATRDSLGPAEEPPRVPFLDGIRGVAILLVILHHGNEVDKINKFDIWFMNLTQTAWCGVDLFFVLSGFLITGILLDTRKSGHYFRSFYARRVVRSFPAYYLTIFAYFYVFFYVFVPENRDMIELKRHEVWYWTYLSNVYTSMHGTWPRAAHMIHLWSVSIEEQFYMLWPAAVLLLNRSRLKFACVCCIVGSVLLRVVLMASHAGAIPTYVSTATRLDGLVMGALIAVMIREPRDVGVLLRNMRILGILAFASLVGFYVAYGGMNMTRIFGEEELSLQSFLIMTLGIFSFSLFFGWLLVYCLTASPGHPLIRGLSNPVLRMFGKYSYFIYLVHLPFHIFVTQKLGIFPRNFPRLFGSQLPGQLVLYGILLISTLVLALISWNLYEKHFLKLKRFFPYGTVVHPGSAAVAEGANRLPQERVAMVPAGKP